MNNAEKFKQVFGLYATELWSMPESDFLEWLNRDVETTQIDHTADIGKKVSISCGQENDLISRQAAIDALAKQMPRSYTPDGSHPADEEIYKAQEIYVDCIESIEILPAVQPEQRWIPCSERYPDMDERVLVYTGAHEYHVWDCMSNRADNYFWEDEEGLYRNKYEASLWMPLPEPYRGGEKE